MILPPVVPAELLNLVHCIGQVIRPHVNYRVTDIGPSRIRAAAHRLFTAGVRRFGGCACRLRPRGRPHLSGVSHHSRAFLAHGPRVHP